MKRIPAFGIFYIFKETYALDRATTKGTYQKYAITTLQTQNAINYIDRQINVPLNSMEEFILCRDGDHCCLC